MRLTQIENMLKDHEKRLKELEPKGAKVIPMTEEEMEKARENNKIGKKLEKPEEGWEDKIVKEKIVTKEMSSNQLKKEIKKEETPGTGRTQATGVRGSE